VAVDIAAETRTDLQKKKPPDAAASGGFFR